MATERFIDEGGIPTAQHREPNANLLNLQEAVCDFCRRRGWTPDDDAKSLAMSIAIESAEIMEVFQWKRRNDPLTPREHEDLSLECADVLWYLLRLCAAQDIDLVASLRKKIQINQTRFPEQT